MSPAPAHLPHFAPLAANDIEPPDTRVCPWRCAIDALKRRGFTKLAAYTAQCKLRGEETYDFAERLIAALRSGEREAV